MLPAVINREHEKAALKQAIIAKDKKTIERLQARVVAPELSEELLLYYNAYLELDSERHYEGGPIPSSAIRGWCEYYGLSFDQFDIMRVVIRKMDNAVITERGKKQPGNGQPTQDREADGHGGDRRQAPRTGTDQVRRPTDARISGRTNTR